jgi:hypothetical protein
LKYPNHPAVYNGKARHGILRSNAIRLNTVTEFELVLPSAAPSDPGSFVGRIDSPTHCPVEIEIVFEAAEQGLGLAGEGVQAGENLVVYNHTAPDSFVDVLLHELGHSMGQTVYVDEYSPPKGLATPKSTNEKDAKYAYNGTKGHVYIGKKHSGPHCAYGLNDAEKKSASYKNRSGSCIMFGENSADGPSLATTGFCPQCMEYIKARDLRNLSSILE